MNVFKNAWEKFIMGTLDVREALCHDCKKRLGPKRYHMVQIITDKDILVTRVYHKGCGDERLFSKTI